MTMSEIIGPVCPECKKAYLRWVLPHRCTRGAWQCPSCLCVVTEGIAPPEFDPYAPKVRLYEAGREPDEDSVYQWVRELTDDQMKAAFENIGFDFSCGACAEIFFTGATFSNNHTCKRHNQAF